ncbi:MAG: hypothetical protein ACRCZD_15680, partial [Phycicoccus sp.]
MSIIGAPWWHGFVSRRETLASVPERGHLLEDDTDQWRFRARSSAALVGFLEQEVTGRGEAQPLVDR